MILLTGATGFVGRHVAQLLRSQGRPVRCLVRDSARAAALVARGCEIAQGEMTDRASLRRAAEGCATVVHLVSIIAGKPADFERVMEQGTRELISAAGEAGARRFLLMSALGTGERTRELTPYYRAKWAMEQSVESSDLEWTIFRPSFVFGRDGGALPLLLRQVRYAPAVPVIGDGKRRLQPIWVDDVAAFVARALSTPAATNCAFELGGPEVVSWNELYLRIARVLGKRRALLHVPLGLVRTGAALAERLPRPPLTRDQLTMLAFADNVCDPAPATKTLGIDPVGLDEQLRRAA